MDSESIIHTGYCPNCDYRLEVHEVGASYFILDNGHAVTVCPNCMIELVYHDGKLKAEG